MADFRLYYVLQFTSAFKFPFLAESRFFCHTSGLRVVGNKNRSLVQGRHSQFLAGKAATVHYGQRGGQNKMASGCMLLTMKSMCQNTSFNEKRPELIQETSGTMFFKARSKFFFGISKSTFEID